MSKAQQLAAQYMSHAAALLMSGRPACFMRGAQQRLQQRCDGQQSSQQGQRLSRAAGPACDQQPSLTLCCAVLCCAVLCCAVLCCAVLCCAVQALADDETLEELCLSWHQQQRQHSEWMPVELQRHRYVRGG
jgi:hypothetical protein